MLFIATLYEINFSKIAWTAVDDIGNLNNFQYLLLISYP